MFNGPVAAGNAIMNVNTKAFIDMLQCSNSNHFLTKSHTRLLHRSYHYPTSTPGYNGQWSPQYTLFLPHLPTAFVHLATTDVYFQLLAQLFVTLMAIFTAVHESTVALNSYCYMQPVNSNW